MSRPSSAASQAPARSASRWPRLWGPSLGLLLIFLIGLFCYRLWVVQSSGISLFFDEAQYWDWAQDLSWGYYSKPPMIAGLIWLSTQKKPSHSSGRPPMSSPLTLSAAR